MMINGRSVERYYASHSKEQVLTVIQTLEAFSLHRELQLFLKNSLYKGRHRAEPQDKLERRLQLLEDKPCPWCGAWKLRGTNVPACEAKESGRTWYEECAICPYYGEEFGGK